MTECQYIILSIFALRLLITLTTDQAEARAKHMPSNIMDTDRKFIVPSSSIGFEKLINSKIIVIRSTKLATKGHTGTLNAGPAGIFCFK